MSFLTDGTVSLEPLEPEDMTQVARWRNDPDIRIRTREFRPLNWQNQEAWFKRISGLGSTDFMFMVRLDFPSGGKGCWIAIGVVGLCHWSPRDRTAECSFYIGDSEQRGKGYATKALMLLHGWGFAEFGLDRIWAESYATNEGGIKTLEKLGYKREGVLRKHVFRNGERVDSVMFGLLKEEWDDGMD